MKLIHKILTIALTLGLTSSNAPAMNTDQASHNSDYDQEFEDESSDNEATAREAIETVECHLCFAQIPQSDAVTTQCGHNFHADCLIEWPTHNQQKNVLDVEKSSNSYNKNVIIISLNMTRTMTFKQTPSTYLEMHV